MEYIVNFESPLGMVTLSSDGKSITGSWFDGQKYYANGLDLDYREEEIPVLLQAKDWLTQYFMGENPGELPPVLPKGTAFQKKVWKLLLEIPYGQLSTYGELAKMIAKDKGLAHMSAQAVGQAVGHNPVGILIPCHRVVGKDGKLTGYAGGMDKKEYLLKMEGFVIENGKIKNRSFCTEGI